MTPYWVWLKIKEPGLRRNQSSVPLTKAYLPMYIALSHPMNNPTGGVPLRESQRFIPNLPTVIPY